MLSIYKTELDKKFEFYTLRNKIRVLNTRNKILISGIIATIISSISYLLLNAYTGMAMCFIAIIRNLLLTT